MRTLITIAGVLSLAACELQRESTPLEVPGGQIMVHSLLVAGSDTAAVLVTELLSGRNSMRAVPGADVRLLHDGEWIDLRALPITGDICTDFGIHSDIAAPGCYTAEARGGILPGATYQLEVRLPGGVITGAATVPPPPVFLDAPWAGQRLRGVDVRQPDDELPQPVRVAWELPEPGVRAHLFLDASDPDCHATIVQVFGYGRSAVDVSGMREFPFRPGHFGCSQESPDAPPTAELAADLTLIAYSANFSRWLDELERNSESVRLKHAAIGITGAFGVFAGAAEARVPVVLVRE